MDPSTKAQKLEELIRDLINRPCQEYIFRECVGRGGYGCVFRLDCKAGPQLNAKAAKVYFLDLVPPEHYDVVFSAIKYERENLKQLLHPNIMTAYRCFNTKKKDDRVDRAFIIMNYFPEGDLDNYVRVNGPLKKRDLEKVLITLIIAVKHMHDKKIIHRDIKPQNVMLNEMEAVLVDFGCSINLETQKVNSYVESKGYTEPGSKTRDKYRMPTDIFSVGATAFFAATAKDPGMFVEGDRFNEQKLKLYLGSEQFSSIDPRIKELIVKAVGPEATRPTAEELLREVDGNQHYQNLAWNKLPKPKPQHPDGYSAFENHNRAQAGPGLGASFTHDTSADSRSPGRQLPQAVQGGEVHNLPSFEPFATPSPGGFFPGFQTARGEVLHNPTSNSPGLQASPQDDAPMPHRPASSNK